MSTICHGFVHNAWRKDICSNCFRGRDEHTRTGIDNSVNCCSSESNVDNKNGISARTPSIVPRSNKINGIKGIGVLVGKGTNTENVAMRPNFLHKSIRFQGTPTSTTSITSSYGASPLSVFGQQGSSYCLPKSSHGIPSDKQFSRKNSGTCNSATATTKGLLIHSETNGSKRNINDGSTDCNSKTDHDFSALSEPSRDTKMGTTESSEKEPLSKTTSSLPLAVSSHLHSFNQPKPQKLMQQEKEVVRNQHPSKTDNVSVILNHNNNNDNKLPMTSAANVVSHLSSTTTTIAGRSASSSYIVSKTTLNNTNATASTSTTPSTTINNCTSTDVPDEPVMITGCLNGNTSALASASSYSSSYSTGLTHPQYTNSFKRGNNASFVALGSSSSLSATLPLVFQSQKNTCSGSTVVEPAVLVGTESNDNGNKGASHLSRNSDRNQVLVNGSSSPVGEKVEGAVVSASLYSSGGSCTSISNGVHVVTSHFEMNRGRLAKPMEMTNDRDCVLDRRKLGPSGVNVSGAQNESYGQLVTSNGTVENSTVVPRTTFILNKGILNTNGCRKGNKRVKFPDEVRNQKNKVKPSFSDILRTI